MELKKSRGSSSISLAAVGDIMLGDHPVRLGLGVRSTAEKAGAEFLFSQTQGLWEGCDIVFGNLEVPLSDKGLERDQIASMEFRGAPSSVPALQRAGFTVLNIANNHCMEHGPEVFWETVTNLQRNDVFAAGIKGKDGRCVPYEFEKDGQRAILLAYSLRAENYAKRQDVPYCLSDEAEIIDDVLRHSRCADIVIVSLHWGEEFMTYPSPRQVVLGHELVEAGAKLILGHHPHSLQGVETYKRGVIVYSLGNFIFDMWQRITRKTMLFSAILSKGLAPSFRITPLLIGDGFQPKPLNGLQAERMHREIEGLNRIIINRYAGLNGIGQSTLDKLENQYQRLARKAYLRHRLENYLYFLAHIHQYKMPVIWQSFRRSFLRRMEEVGSRLS